MHARTKQLAACEKNLPTYVFVQCCAIEINEINASQIFD